jgi:CheY-like chemotaxis protein
MPHALIIDDDANNLGIMVEMLAAEGITATTVQNPLQVEGVLKTIAHLDVVFLDLEMPGLNGYDVLSRLRASSKTGGVPVVACTVHVNEMSHARAMGFHSFLGKPLDADEFPEHLARILKGEAVWSLR